MSKGKSTRDRQTMSRINRCFCDLCEQVVCFTLGGAVLILRCDGRSVDFALWLQP